MSHVISREYELLTETDADARFAEAYALFEKAAMMAETGSSEATQVFLKAKDLLIDLLLHHPENFYHPESLENLRAFADEMSDDPRWADMEHRHMLWLFRLDNGHLPTSTEEINAWYIRTKPKGLYGTDANGFAGHLRPDDRGRLRV